ncbi:hypothetical protein F7725_012349 [Dissostichus mawsoni]|uniref:PARP catalytic domain-containing protein n=1 Tax=Dissostichus mawsoni TaxID=36200 RepID=A0A7J5YQB0_DISMA|nr:hypothetical protein F7725_012349 [Dissostichus mawsoni]
MSVQFSGWEVFDDGASFPGLELDSSQKPQSRGVYTMYHGTSITSARVIIANVFKGHAGMGVYVSRNIKKATAYPLRSNPTDRVVLQVHVRVGRVKRIDKDNHPMQQTWHSLGYDTAWVPPKVGLLAVRSGLEEDCVVKVVCIAKAPNDSIQKELQELLIQSSGRGGEGAAEVCSLCKRKTQQGAPHIKQQCWECGKNICILMSKHFCPAKP